MMQLLQTTLGDFGILFVALLVILASSEIFTNGIEWLGQKLQLSEGVVGSVLAAVGTALPETLIPIVAVFGRAEQFHDIGVGAISGAPFMLTTLTMCVCGIAVLLFCRLGLRPTELKFSIPVLKRDLSFFIFAYTVGLLATLAQDLLALRQAIAFCLLLIYVVYLRVSFAHEGEVGEVPEKLYFDRLLKSGNGLFIVILQVAAGLGGILWGANVFVEKIHTLSLNIGVPAVILSMIVAPIATELPEKCNSVIWLRAKKDTLALGNISGALVFQSCFPVAFGVAFTKWNLGLPSILGGIVAISSAAVMLYLVRKNALSYRHLLAGGVLYAAVIGFLLWFNATST